MRAGVFAIFLLTSAARAEPAEDPNMRAPRPPAEGAASTQGSSADPSGAVAPAKQSPQPEVQANAPVAGDAKPEPAPPTPPPLSEAICPLIESAAAANGLPVEFFTRLIWQESSFRAHVVSPAGARGVAQFMPATAAERGLEDPFDPEQALPKSAELLRDLRSQFGNLGLAAAAYNAGPRRVQNWLSGLGGLPAETRDYVFRITGRSAEDWTEMADAAKKPDAAAGKSKNCRRFAMLATLSGAGRAPGVKIARKGGPWGVQIAGHFSRSVALASFEKTQRRFRKVLGGRAPMVIRSRMRGRGARAFYKVRIGMKTRESANDLCTKLRAAGGSCVVLKN